MLRKYSPHNWLADVTPTMWARVLLIITGIIILCTFRNYGVTWDEELQSQYGLAVVDYYTSLFKDHRFDEIFNLYLYGGMFDGMASAIDRLTPFHIYETRHLLNALVGLLGLWGTWRLGKLIGGEIVGLLALILLLTTPMYYGHMFNNPKDVPFAAGVVWTLYYMGRCLAANAAVVKSRAKQHRLDHERWNLVIKLGIVYGLTLGIRVGGVMVLAFWLLPVGIQILQSRGHWRPLILRTATVIAIAYIVMLICWPWAQENPIANPLRALSEFSNFPQDVEVLLNGVIYRSTELPWYYVPVYFGVQLPLLLLGLWVLAMVSLPVLMRKMSEPKQQTLLTIFLTSTLPPLYAVLRHPALYDAVRHFLFVVPLACVLAALVAYRVHQWAVIQFWQNWSRRMVSGGLILIATIMLAMQIYIMIRLHPYEYIYANELTGGVQGAYGKFETDYWGSSFKEATAGLQAFVAKEGGIPEGKIYKIAICGPWDSVMNYLPPDYEPVEGSQPADFFISTTRWMCQNMRPGRDIVVIKRMGVPLSVVKDLRGGYEKMPKVKKHPASRNSPSR